MLVRAHVLCLHQSVSGLLVDQPVQLRCVVDERVVKVKAVDVHVLQRYLTVGEDCLLVHPPASVVVCRMINITSKNTSNAQSINRLVN